MNPLINELLRINTEEKKPGQKHIGIGTAGHSQFISSEAAAAFIYNGEILNCNSENVASAQYNIKDHILIIQYKGGGSPWSYEPISELQAIDFVKADSKNGWIWDNIRVRGTKHQHKVNARRVQ